MNIHLNRETPKKRAEGATAPLMDWFEKLIGFREVAYNDTLERNPRPRNSAATRGFAAPGKFTSPALKEWLKNWTAVLALDVLTPSAPTSREKENIGALTAT
jgi:hypothetical protein